jgi:hypothetical protein
MSGQSSRRPDRPKELLRVELVVEQPNVGHQVLSLDPLHRTGETVSLHLTGQIGHEVDADMPASLANHTFNARALNGNGAAMSTLALPPKATLDPHYKYPPI